MNSDRQRTLYHKYLQGHCTLTEYEEVREFLIRMQDASELANVESIESITELDIQLDSSRSKEILDQIFIKRTSSKKRRYLSYIKYAAAASIILIGCLCFYLMREQQITYPIYRNTDNIVKRIILSDQTSVYLKPNASITQISNFEVDSIRSIHLKGEAFFAIHKDKKQPFVVQSSQGLVIRVLGTRFYANFGQKNESVVLTEGSVSVSTDHNKLTLKPQEMALFRGRGMHLERQVVDTSVFNAWIDNQIYFKEQPLSGVIKRLNEVYPEANLYINSSFHKLRFTGYLPNNNLEQALKILQRTFVNHKLTIIQQE